MLLGNKRPFLMEQLFINDRHWQVSQRLFGLIIIPSVSQGLMCIVVNCQFGEGTGGRKKWPQVEEGKETWQIAPCRPGLVKPPSCIGAGLSALIKGIKFGREGCVCPGWKEMLDDWALVSGQSTEEEFKNLQIIGKQFWPRPVVSGLR